MDRIAAHVFIYGDVIGVGYRYWIIGEARKLQIYGWVKNLPDCVEAVFEGEKGHVEKLVTLCNEGPLTSNVTRVQTEYPPFTGKYTEFVILR